MNRLKDRIAIIEKVRDILSANQERPLNKLASSPGNENENDNFLLVTSTGPSADIYGSHLGLFKKSEDGEYYKQLSRDNVKVFIYHPTVVNKM